MAKVKEPQREEVYHGKRSDGKTITFFVSRRTVEAELADGEANSKVRYSIEQRCNTFYVAVASKNKKLNARNIQDALTEFVDYIAENYKSDGEFPIHLPVLRISLETALSAKEEESRQK